MELQVEHELYIMRMREICLEMNIYKPKFNYPKWQKLVLSGKEGKEVTGKNA